MGFLELPAEIRDQVYACILCPEANRRKVDEGRSTYNYAPALALFRVNRQISREASTAFWKLNAFVRIHTPWEQAKHHVAAEQDIAIIASDEKADKFTKHVLSVTIAAPAHMLHQPMDSFVVSLDDLSQFCKSWYYSNLSMPNLNGHLTLKLTLRDPFNTALEDKRVLKPLQRRLLEPFGQIKNLMRLDVNGVPEPEDDVVEEMKRLMAVPLDSPEKCLADSTQWKDAGNAELKAGRYNEALECYRKAFSAIHIIVKGRQRFIHGDQWFDRILEEAPFQDKHGSTVRVILRIRLVANTLLAYLKMEDYDMVVFTGMRTIRLIRENIGLPNGQEAPDPSQEMLGDFVASSELGKIYFRTALAYKAQKDRDEARKLLRVAVLYLPDDIIVQQELASCALLI